MKSTLILIIGTSFLFLMGCEDTYKRDTMTQSIQDLAKNEYNHDVVVAEVGETIGIQLQVPNILGELAAEDQLIWRQMEELMLVLSRVVLSSDRSPQFIVLDVVDQDNPHVHLLFTRYVSDIKKLMVEAISRTSFLDRLLMEFVIGEKRLIFDPYEMDMVRLMMMAAETLVQSDEDVNEGEWKENWLEEVYLDQFLPKVASNTLRRIFREEDKLQDQYLLRKISASFDNPSVSFPQFKILLDLVSIPGQDSPSSRIQSFILPRVAKEIQTLFRSYQFDQFSKIKVVEKNSGELLIVGKK